MERGSNQQASSRVRSGQSPDPFGCTKSPENASSSTGRKYRLVPVSQFDSAEPLDAIGGTLRLCRTPVKKTPIYTMVFIGYEKE